MKSRIMAMATLVERIAKKNRSRVIEDTAPTARSRGATPGRRQSTSVARRAKTTASASAAKAMRMHRTTLPGALV
jgi:hypothetical protein